MNEYNVSKAIKAQEELCKKEGYPDFAPHSGVCWNCRRNIYEVVEHDRKDCYGSPTGEKFTTGISVEKAGTELVTGCPHCNRSYCD